jgi:DNA-binding response OmpR family regulator
MPVPDPVPWIILARDGPATGLASLLPTVAMRLLIVADDLAGALASENPNVVILTAPPARLADIALVGRLREQRPGLVAILLDPPEAVSERLWALELGLTEALPSTVDMEELVGRLRVLTRHRPMAGLPPGTPIGPGLYLDTTAHELRLNNAVIRLRPREYQLLELLSANPGRAFSRRELLERIWGNHRHVGPRTVDVHVRWLRAKIEEEPTEPRYLVTVRGVGYRLDANGSS